MRLQIHICIQMTNQLVAIEVKINPGSGTTPLTAAKNAAVEFPGFVEVMHLYRQVKRINHYYNGKIVANSTLPFFRLDKITRNDLAFLH